MSFLPDGYKTPKKPGKYLKFQKGDNRFRILGRPHRDLGSLTQERREGGHEGGLRVDLDLELKTHRATIPAIKAQAFEALLHSEVSKWMGIARQAQIKGPTE